MVKSQKKNRCLLTLLFIVGAQFSFGQKSNFLYERSVENLHGRWGSFLLPDEIYGKVKSDFSDIRILGVSSKKDTVEVPYWIESTETKPVVEEHRFQLLNTTNDKDVYYFTFEPNTLDAINQLDVAFQQTNYDWNVRLEGSQDQAQWSTIVDDYRLLSIKNEQTNYAFTSVKFPDAKFRYFRLLVKTTEKPELKNVSLTRSISSVGLLTIYSLNKLEVANDKQKKQTIVDVELPYPVPVNTIKLFTNKDFNYFRTISAEYVTNSYKNEQGLQYIYSPLVSGALNSKGDNVLRFSNTLMKRLRLVIEDNDNQPLEIDSVQVLGSPYRLIGYFVDSSAQFVLRYGNPDLHPPQYDIEHFKGEMPADIPVLTLGKEVQLSAINEATKETFSLSKIWVWIVMVVLIALLGFFAFKMMKKAEG